MKIKTSELIGPALDWAVAVAEGRFKSEIRDEQNRPGTSITDIDFDEDGNLMVYVPGPRGLVRVSPYTLWAPSRLWAQGGPIFERECIEMKYLGYDRPPYWGALKFSPAKYERQASIGPTPLIAANRCHVASRLGDEVDIPKGLLKYFRVS